jgi:hypothetical protein
MRGVQKIHGKLTPIAGFRVEDDESSITDDAMLKKLPSKSKSTTAGK